MGRLEEVEKQLYGKEKETEENLQRRATWRMFSSRARSRTPSIWIPEHAPSGPQGSPMLGHPWWYFFGAVFLVLIALSGIFIFFYLRAQGQEARIEIQSSDTLEAGGIITIPIVYKNVSHTTLHDGEIVVTLPQGALLREQGRDQEPPARLSRHVEDLKPGDQGVIEISARLFGQEREDEKIQALYYYRPENLRAQFSARTDKTVRIIKVPLALSWEIPETLSRGQDVSITVHYVLDSPLAFEHMAMRMEYPSGFALTSAEPKALVGDTIWDIGRIEPGQEGIITLHGTMIGEEGEVKAFRSSLGTFNELTKEWRTYSESSKEVTIAVTPLSVQGFLGKIREGVVKPGETLNFVIRYRNNTNVILKNITVKALFDGSVLDRLTLRPSDEGVVDSHTGAAVWGPGDVPQLRQLQPNESGELQAVIQVKDPPPVMTEQDKNLKVVMHSSISTASTPDELKGTNLSSEDSIEFKVASKVIFSGKALHGASPIPNTGAFPPQVGKKTTYTIVWEVKNFTNDIVNAEVAATLPANVTWENVTKTDGTSITYNAASSEVRWHIGTVPAGTGVRTPTLTGAFQVSITPAITDRNNLMKLVNPPRLTGTDSFANIPVDQEINAMMTDIPSDPTAKSGDGTVR